MSIKEAWDIIEEDILEDHEETPEYLAKRQEAIDTINGVVK